MTIRCGKRKEQKCKEAAEECTWDGQKCHSIKVKDTKSKNVRCGKCKMETCKLVPNVCKWEGDKCVAIVNSKPKVTPYKPKTSKSIRCGRRKLETCNQVPEACVWDGNKCVSISSKAKPPKTPKVVKVTNVQKVQKPLKVIIKKDTTPKLPKKTTPQKVPSPPKPKIPSPPKTPSPKPDVEFLKLLKELPRRHCFYYSKDAHKTLRRSELVKLDTEMKVPYEHSYQPPTNVHIGQRKLLLSEIQLLTKWYQEHHYDPVVLYVGAAPGTHLILLSYMFPNVYFILYDGAKFDRILSHYPNIYEVHEGKDGFVDTKLVHSIKKRFMDSSRLIFVSDIRLGADSEYQFESGVTEDMKRQQEWMEILRPKMSLLKFRMSYHMKHGEKLRYTKGDLYYQVWPKDKSGETRLLVRQKDIDTKVDYDFKEYEETMFFHNKYSRPFCYSHTPPDVKKWVLSKQNTYCPCYDCLSELSIIHDYCRVMNQNFDQTVYFVASHMNKEKVPVFQNKGMGITPALQPILTNALVKK